MKELNHCPSSLLFLTDMMKRTYLRIVKERIQRFNRKSE